MPNHPVVSQGEWLKARIVDESKVIVPVAVHRQSHLDCSRQIGILLHFERTHDREQVVVCCITVDQELKRGAHGQEEASPGIAMRLWTPNASGIIELLASQSRQKVVASFRKW